MTAERAGAVESFAPPGADDPVVVPNHRCRSSCFLRFPM
jgi:hypothetical protein